MTVSSISSCVPTPCRNQRVRNIPSLDRRDGGAGLGAFRHHSRHEFYECRRDRQVALVRAKWSLTADKFGLTNLCAAVTIRNQNKSKHFFNDINMTMRPPMSSVTVLNFTAKHALDSSLSELSREAISVSPISVSTSPRTRRAPTVQSVASGSSTSDKTQPPFIPAGFD